MAIPVDTGVWGYAQVLNSGDVRLFNYFTKEIETDLEKILVSDTIARKIINAGLEKGIWKSIGNAAIPEEYRISRYYLPDASNPELFRMETPEGIIRGLTRADVVGLSRHAVWDAETIQYRLNRFYHKLPDIYDAKNRPLGWVLE